MAILKQSTAFTRTFLMVDSADHVSPKTGLTVGVWLSKAGAAFTAVSGSVSEISFGWYKVALNATDTNTLGDLAFHCTGTAADLTDFNDQVTANILGDTLPANVTQWVGVAPNALISGTVDGNIHYPNPIIAVATGTVSANVIQWKGATPNDLITGTVDAFTHYSNPIPSFLTGTVNANVIQWVSQNVPTPSNTGVPKVNVTNWLSGSVSNPNLVGVPKVDLVDIDGLATNGNNATLNLKQLNIVNNSGNALMSKSTGGNGCGMQLMGEGLGEGLTISGGISGNAVTITGGSLAGQGIHIDSPTESAVSIFGEMGIGIEITSAAEGIQILSGIDYPALALYPSGIGQSINAPNGIYGDIIGNITGSMTGNIYGDVHGYVGWVTGSVQQVLISTPAAPPTGTVNANVIQWIGATPNSLISGTVDAFAHYGNFPAATITGSIDANIISWRGVQPNNLVSGTVDAFVHYSNPVQAFVTGTIDANVELWRGGQPNNLISGTIDAFTHYANPVPSYPTGTVNSNLILWEGVVPNALISGTVDAFTHYANPLQAYLTGTVDANVQLWRNGQPNSLVSGTVDSYAHYVADKTDYALTSAYNAAKTASQAGDAMTLTAGERISIADALLKRDWTAVTGEASRSVLNALRFIRNKFSTTAHANKVTIYKEDDISEAYQKDVTTDATADPIVEG